MGAERRQHARVPLGMVVQFRLASMEAFLRDVAVNVSAGGMFIQTRSPHSEGTMLYFQFHLSDGHKLIEGLGRVVHVNPPAHAVPGMGIEFVNLDRESKDLIDRIIAGRLDSAPGAID